MTDLMRLWRNEMTAGELKLEDPPDHPMSLEENVRWSLLIYPCLYQSKGDVLHHMYFVIGNGYDWVNGQMLDRWCIPEDMQKFVDKVYAHAETLPPEAEVSARKFEIALKNQDGAALSECLEVAKSMGLMEYISRSHDIQEFFTMLRMRDQVEDRLKEVKWSRERKPYPVCSTYAKFWTLPDDCQEDYLLAAIEAGEEYLRHDPQPEVQAQLEVLKEKAKCFGPS